MENPVFTPNTATAPAPLPSATNQSPMSNFLAPSINPTITQTTQNQTTAPDWYNNFLSGLAQSGQTAINQGGVAGASPLQSMAYNAAPSAVTAGQGTTNAAVESAANVAGTPTSSLINQYMDPYTNSVINSIGQLGTRQYNELLAPAANAAAVGSGQFGSTRGQTVQADVARDVANNITAQQAQALNTQYNNAIAAAQNQQNLGLNAATTLGNLGSSQQSQGVAGLNALSTLGGQQQTTEQAQLNYPITALQNYAQLMSGLNIPTGVSQAVTGPAGSGQMGPSPLTQIAGLGTSLGTLLTTPTSLFGGTSGGTLGSSLGNYLGIGNSTNTAVPDTGMPSSTNVAGSDSSGRAVYGNATSGYTYNDGSQASAPTQGVPISAGGTSLGPTNTGDLNISTGINNSPTYDNSLSNTGLSYSGTGLSYQPPTTDQTPTE